jgi:nucleotide-binding universal stress UspA family protein
MNVTKILVPVDFSEYSDKAVDYALYLAENYDAEVTLLHVIVLYREEPDEEVRIDEYEQLIRQKEEQRYKLLQVHRKNANKKGVTIESELVRGFSAADTIIEYIQDNKFDLIILGNHGRSGFKKWIYGSVAEKVVRFSTIPVLTTHCVTRQVAFEEILIPVDFSEYSRKAVRRGSELSKKFNAKVHFMHSVEQQFHPSFYAADIDSVFEIDPDLKTRVSSRLGEFSRMSESKAKFFITEGKPHKEIAKYAQQNNIDLIVMAAKGSSNLEHFLVGSNAERVICIAPCPVLTVGRH